jgi:hypothetical protein
MIVLHLLLPTIALGVRQTQPEELLSDVDRDLMQNLNMISLCSESVTS